MATYGTAGRQVVLGPDLPGIPEDLLLAHSRGEVLFVCGAGVSMSAGLPSFKSLVLGVYEELDPATCEAMKEAQARKSSVELDGSNLDPRQTAELTQFVAGEYDTVLGMLERRLDRPDAERRKVRDAVVTLLRKAGDRPAAIHRAIMRLADRGPGIAVVTTNYDGLLEVAAAARRPRPRTYEMGAIPMPTKDGSFSGVFHIHGALPGPGRVGDLVLTDRDFGDFYLRRRSVPDFLYDAARLFNLVLVGYSANDAPMRYLLNAVAADGTRFMDIKKRFSFVGEGSSEDAVLEGWHARGITPIPYSPCREHADLEAVLTRWADLSAINGRQQRVHAAVRRIVGRPRKEVSEADRDLFGYLYRRGSDQERLEIAQVVSTSGAEPGWLQAMLDIVEKPAAGVAR